VQCDRHALHSKSCLLMFRAKANEITSVIEHVRHIAIPTICGPEFGGCLDPFSENEARCRRVDHVLFYRCTF
jgi:hypothetical protein